MATDFDDLVKTAQAEPTATTQQQSEGWTPTKAMQAVGLTGYHAVADPIEGLVQGGASVIGDTVKNFTQPGWTVPGESLYDADVAARQDLENRAVLNKNSHSVISLLQRLGAHVPVAGPLVQDIAGNVATGLRNGDPEAVGRGVGGAASFVLPGELESALGKGGALESQGASLAERLRSSAAANYAKIFDLPDSVEGASKVPQAERISSKLVDLGNAPRANSRTGLINQMEQGKLATGAAIDQALGSTNMTVDGRELVKELAQYARDKYATPNANGVPIVHDPVGIQQMSDLIDRIQEHATPSQQPGLVAPGQTIPPAATDVLTQRAVNTLRQNLEKGTLDNKGQWKDKIDPKSLQQYDRDHAGVLRDFLAQKNPDLQKLNSVYEMYAKGKQFLQDAYNRNTVKRGIDLPINLTTGRLSIPKPLNALMTSVPWNTTSAATKLAVSKALVAGDWGAATHILQFARLGVPYDGGSSDGR